MVFQLLKESRLSDLLASPWILFTKFPCVWRSLEWCLCVGWGWGCVGIFIFNCCCTYFVSCLANVNPRSYRGKFLPSEAAISRRDPSSSRSFNGLPLSRNAEQVHQHWGVPGTLAGATPKLVLALPPQAWSSRTCTSPPAVYPHGCAPHLPEAGKAHFFSFGSVSLRMSEPQPAVPKTSSFLTKRPEGFLVTCSDKPMIPCLTHSWALPPAPSPPPHNDLC